MLPHPTFFQIIILVLAAIAAYRLWDEIVWLAIVVVIAAFSFGVHGDEAAHRRIMGAYSTATATRLALTTLVIVGIFLYSLFV